MSFIVAIDGPAGSGKGSVTELLSKRLGLINIDSGAAYRCVALACIEKGVSLEQKNEIIKLLDEIKIEYKNENGKNIVYLNGEDVSLKIRQPDVTKTVSQISSIKEVRFKLNEIFRKYAEVKNVVMEGRDIGTYVFPNADIKFYLDASAEERAERRYRQNKEAGIEQSFEDVLENIKLRDKNDMEKEIGALKKADDAYYIDSTGMSLEEETDAVEKIINFKMK